MPGTGVQPQVAVSADGAVHMVYLTGDPSRSDVYYARRSPSGDWSSPVRVNSANGSAIAMGTVRGAHVALGRTGRVHVAWNGSPGGDHMTVFYARSNEGANGFEPQRDLVTWASGLDGGGSVAADAEGRVYVVWHAPADTRRDDASRVVVLARSRDDGAHFMREEVVSAEGSGVCACCGLRALAAGDRLWIVYRAARGGTGRDMVLLSSADRGATFEARTLEPWAANTCPMSTSFMVRANAGVVAAWETGDRVRFQSVPFTASSNADPITEPPSTAGIRKHPVLALNEAGELLAVWTEGTGWNKSGSLAWQRYARDGRPVGHGGHGGRVPAWSLAAAAPLPDGRFLILH
jgi:hypothetical protein